MMTNLNGADRFHIAAAKRAALAAPILIAGGILFCGAIGPWSDFADIANVMKPMALLVMAAAIIGFGGFRKWGGLLLVLFLCTVSVIGGWSGSALIWHLEQQPQKLDPHGFRLKIISVNLWNENRTPALLTDWILRQNADVVVLLEASRNSENVPHLLAHSYPFQASCTVNNKCSTWVLTRQRPREVIRLSHGDPENRKTLSAVAVRLVGTTGLLTVIGVHMPRPFPVGPQRRDLEQLCQAIRRINDTHIIVAGDFNASPLMFAMQRLYESTGTRPVAELDGSWPSQHSRIWLPFALPFDQILVGKGWDVQSHGMGPSLGSDHRPVWAQLVQE